MPSTLDRARLELDSMNRKIDRKKAEYKTLKNILDKRIEASARDLMALSHRTSREI